MLPMWVRRLGLPTPSRVSRWPPQWGAWKWNFLAPVAARTMSKTPNWPAVRVPIITHRALRPVVQSFMKPVSFAMFIRRDAMLPSPPAPALLILDSRVSAGWEMMAAATPAITPEPRDTVMLPALLMVLGLWPMVE